MAGGLRFGGIGERAAHLCVDMQRLFGPGSPWEVPWMERVAPVVARLAGAHPQATVFTRFIPPPGPDDAVGSWRRYYQRWPMMTRAAIEPRLLEVVDELEMFVPRATVLDKASYSPWWDGRLRRLLGQRGVDTLVITGGETDVCVLASALGAIDVGYRTILVEDAVCSSADETHEALMRLYRSRFSEQLEVASCDEVLAAWSPF